MENQRTLGPWEVFEQGNADEYCLIGDSKRWIISFHQNGELSVNEQKAIAQLIEAGPDMLIALKMWTAFWDDMKTDKLGRIIGCNAGLLDKTRRAIAKAEGPRGMT